MIYGKMLISEGNVLVSELFLSKHLVQKQFFPLSKQDIMSNDRLISFFSFIFDNKIEGDKLFELLTKADFKVIDYFSNLLVNVEITRTSLANKIVNPQQLIIKKEVFKNKRRIEDIFNAHDCFKVIINRIIDHVENEIVLFDKDNIFKEPLSLRLIAFRDFLIAPFHLILSENLYIIASVVVNCSNINTERELFFLAYHPLYPFSARMRNHNGKNHLGTSFADLNAIITYFFCMFTKPEHVLNARNMFVQSVAYDGDFDFHFEWFSKVLGSFIINLYLI